MFERLFKLKRRCPLPAVPNGWYAIAASAELAPGQVFPVQAFDRDLVLVRTEAGTACLFDAYCPHLGMHLGYGGKVVGDTVQCPFHGWRFDCSGRCVEVPFAEKIPPRAELRRYPVQETDGIIAAYYHTQGEAPSWALPTRLSDAAQWSASETTRWRVQGHIQELAENSVDTVHATFVHNFLAPTTLRPPAEEGPIWRIGWDQEVPLSHYGRTGAPLPIDPAALGIGSAVRLRHDLAFHGLGVSYVDSLTVDFGIVTLSRFYLTPLDDECHEVRCVTNVRLAEGMARETGDMINKILHPQIVLSTKEDSFLFEHKRYVERPLLSSADGPYARIRRWARQFYSSEVQHGNG